METRGQIYPSDAVVPGGSPGVGALGGLISPRVSLETIQKKKKKISYLLEFEMQWPVCPLSSLLTIPSSTIFKRCRFIKIFCPHPPPQLRPTTCNFICWCVIIQSCSVYIYISIYTHTVMNTTILQLVAIYNIQLHVSALYIGHHQVVQRIY